MRIGTCLPSTSPRCAALAAVPLQRGVPRRHGGISIKVQAAAGHESFFDAVKRVAKKVQGALPIVGLLSRLASPEGGFDELAYPEFCRSMYEKGSSSTFRQAMTDFEKQHGKPATSKYVLLVLWFAALGVGIVPSRDIISAARRLRVTQDIEIEIDRFDLAKRAVLAKYEMMRPEGKLQDKLAVAVDAVSTLSIGLKDGEAVPERDVSLLSTILAGAFPEADAAAIADAVAKRPARAGVYA